jgi:hypothetical protein
METTYKTIESTPILESVERTLNSLGIEYYYSRQQLAGTKEQFTFRLHGLTTTIHGDECTPQILITNSYAKESALIVGVGTFRLVCTNGLIVGDVTYKSRIVHRTGPTADMKLDELPHKLFEAVCYIRECWASDIEEATSTKLSEQQMIDITGNLRVPDVVKDRTIAQVALNIRRPEDGANTVWALFNLVNENIRKCSRSDNARVTHNKNLLEDINLLAAA